LNLGAVCGSRTICEQTNQVSHGRGPQGPRGGRVRAAPYADEYGPKRFTQRQLFACLVLKVFFKTDYRGLSTLLSDLADLRDALLPNRVPEERS
jgi:hypothetical protein